MERFTLQVVPNNFEYDRALHSAMHFPAFESVLSPLLKQALRCYIYGLKNSEVKNTLQQIIVADRGKYRLDLEKEVIEGFEWFWHSGYPDRGSIVILIDPKQMDLTPIFSHCFDVLIMDNPNTGHTPSAVQFCRKQSGLGLIAICITETNGLEWLDLFASVEQNLYEAAVASCNTKTDHKEWKPVKKRRKLPGTI